MKKIILMRHGEYLEEDLTETGQKQVDATAKKLAAEGIVPDLILYSPLTRAEQTAKRVQQVFNRVAGRNTPAEMNPTLCNFMDRHSIEELFGQLDDQVDVVLAVSHEPDIAKMSGKLECTIYPRVAEANVFEADVASWKELHAAHRTDSFVSGVSSLWRAPFRKPNKF